MPQAAVDRYLMELREEETPQVEALDGGVEFDEHLLGNVLGLVVITRDAVSCPENRLLLQFKESPQGLHLPSLTPANSILFLLSPSHYRSQLTCTLQYILLLAGQQVHIAG